MYMVCIGDMGFYMDLTGVVAADMGVGLGLRAYTVLGRGLEVA